MAAVTVEETTTAVMGAKMTVTPTMAIASMPARNTTTMTRAVMVNQVMANLVDMPQAMVAMILLA